MQARRGMTTVDPTHSVVDRLPMRPERLGHKHRHMLANLKLPVLTDAHRLEVVMPEVLDELVQRSVTWVAENLDGQGGTA